MIKVVITLVFFLSMCSSANTSKEQTSMEEIIIYMQSGVDLDVRDNAFFSSSDLDVKGLNKGLSNYDIKLSKLQNQAENDSFNAERRQQIFNIRCSEKSKAILEFLLSQTQFIQSAYIKAEAEDPATDDF